MKKTLFLSESRNISHNGIPCMVAQYIFFDGKKWRQDNWYYSNLAEIKQEAKKQDFLIK